MNGLILQYGSKSKHKYMWDHSFWLCGEMETGIQAFTSPCTNFMKWPKSVNIWDSSFLIHAIVARIKMKLCIWKGIINSKVTDMCKGMLLLLNYSRTWSGLWCDFVGASERILCSITFWPKTSQFGSRDSLKIEVPLILELERTCSDLTTSFYRCGSCGQENCRVPKFT